MRPSGTELAVVVSLWLLVFFVLFIVGDQPLKAGLLLGFGLPAVVVTWNILFHWIWPTSR